LISSTGPTTATGLSRLSGNQISHDKITRFLREAYLDSRGLWQHPKPLVRQIEGEDGVLIVDDSIAQKAYTDENALITWHWDHSKQRHIQPVLLVTMVREKASIKI
jgi:hypothetical protein